MLQGESSEASEGTNVPCNSASSAQHCSTATSPIAQPSAVPGSPLAAMPELCRTGRPPYLASLGILEMLLHCPS